MSSTPAMRRLSREPMAAASRAGGPGDAERSGAERRDGGGERPAPTAAARGTPGERVRPPRDYNSRRAPQRRRPTAARRGTRTPHGLPAALRALCRQGALPAGPGRSCTGRRRGAGTGLHPARDGCAPCTGDVHGGYPDTHLGWGCPGIHPATGMHRRDAQRGSPGTHPAQGCTLQIVQRQSKKKELH